MPRQEKMALETSAKLPALPINHRAMVSTASCRALSARRPVYFRNRWPHSVSFALPLFLSYSHAHDCLAQGAGRDPVQE
jgi:hypothetical protein